MSDRIDRTTPIRRAPELERRMPAQLQQAGVNVFLMGACRIIITHEPEGWHLSISCEDRDPSWDEIASARYRLLPDIAEMGMFLPPLTEYVNMHPHCFHLYEQRRSSLILPT